MKLMDYDTILSKEELDLIVPDEEQDRQEEVLSVDKNSDFTEEMINLEESLREFDKISNEAYPLLTVYAKLQNNPQASAIEITTAHEALRRACDKLHIDLNLVNVSYESVSTSTVTAYHLACEGFGSFIKYVINFITRLLQKIWVWIRSAIPKLLLWVRSNSSKIQELKKVVNDLNIPNKLMYKENYAYELTARCAGVNAIHLDGLVDKGITKMLELPTKGIYNSNNTAFISGLEAILTAVESKNVKIDEELDKIKATIATSYATYHTPNVPKTYLDNVNKTYSLAILIRNKANKVHYLTYDDNKKFDISEFNIHRDSVETMSKTYAYLPSKAELLNMLTLLDKPHFKSENVSTTSNTILDAIDKIQKKLVEIESDTEKGSGDQTKALAELLRMCKIGINLYTREYYWYILDCYKLVFLAVEAAVATVNDNTK